MFWTRVGVRPCIHRERTGVEAKVALTLIICSNLKTDLIPSHYKRCLKLGSLKVTQQFLCLLIIFIVHQDEMGVSKNNGTPKSSILIGLSIINHPFWGVFPLFLETSRYVWFIFFFGEVEVM